MNRVFAGVSLLACQLIFLSEGINEAIISPIYPLRAINIHGSSQTIVAVTLAMYSIGQIFTCCLLLFLRVKQYERIIFVVAALFSAIFIVMFGFTDKINDLQIFNMFNMLSRFAVGVATASLWSVVFSIVNNYYGALGKKFSNTFVPMYYFGMSIGPQISLYMCMHINYTAPFYLCGLLEVIFAIGSSFIFFEREPALPTFSDSNENNDLVCLYFFKNIRVIVLLMNILYANIAYGFYDGILAQFLTEVFGATDAQLNLAYLAINVPLLPSSLYFGCYLSGKGYSFVVVLIAMIIYTFSSFLIFLSNYTNVLNNFYFVCVLIFFIFVARGSIVAAMYIVLDVYISKKYPDRDCRSALVFIGSTILLFAMLGAIIGSAFFIGIIKVYFGLQFCFLSVAVVGFCFLMNYVFFFVIYSDIFIFKKQCNT